MKKNQDKVKQKRDGFVMLPRWLWETQKLTGKEKLICIDLAYHRNKHTKLCCPSIPTLCLECNLSKPIVLKIRKKLAKLGFISFEKGLGGKHYAKYILNWLDGSKEEIKRLKEIPKQKELVKKLTSLTGKKIYQLTGKKENLQLVKKRTTNNKEFNNNKYKQQQEGSAAISSFSIKPQTQKKLESYGLSNEKIKELILKVINFGNNIDEYFDNWIAFIEKNPKDNPAGFLITMVEGKQYAAEKHKSANLIQEAIEDLERFASVDRIVEWLNKIPESQHSKLEKRYKQKYPKEKFFTEAETKYQQNKEKNQ